MSFDLATLNVEVLGASHPPLLVLHGWGHSATLLRPLADLLSADYTVYLIDLPGFGKTPRPSATWGSAEYAECIYRYLAEKGIGPALVFGHSFGGAIALQLAAAHAESVKGLVLCGTRGLKRQQEVKTRLRSFYIRALRSVVKCLDASFGRRWYEEYFIPHFGSADYQAAGNLRDILVRVVNEDLSDLAARVRVPTRLVWGELDTETPVEFGYRYRRLIPGARLLVLPDCGHNFLLGAGAHLCAFHLLPLLRELQRGENG